MGRYGKDIAKFVGELDGKSHIKKIVSIPYMADIVCKMIDDALVVFENKDVSKFLDFSERDDIANLY